MWRESCVCTLQSRVTWFRWLQPPMNCFPHAYHQPYLLVNSLPWAALIARLPIPHVSPYKVGSRNHDQDRPGIRREERMSNKEGEYSWAEKDQHHSAALLRQGKRDRCSFEGKNKCLEVCITLAIPAVSISQAGFLRGFASSHWKGYYSKGALMEGISVINM